MPPFVMSFITCVCVCNLFEPSPTVAQDVRSIPLISEITRVQPMTGIVLWSDNDNAVKHPDAITLEYRYCGYDEVVKPNGKYDYTKIDSILDAIAKSERKKTHFCDWSNKAFQDFLFEFYSKFADRYDNDPRIAFLQTGFGLWAEYHIYDGPKKLGKTFPSKKYQARFLRHMDKQFNNLPWSISIDAADYDYTPLEDNDELLAIEFGVFDDSFLCKPHPKENAVNWKILGSHRWKRQPGGGEFSYYNSKDQKKALTQNGPNGVSFKAAAKQFHITYMIGNDQPRYQPIERIRSAGMTTGYRFRVTAASVKGHELLLQVTNDGVAPIYRDAYFTAGAKRSKNSLRGLLPTESRVCRINGVSDKDLKQITIQSDAILPSQSIQFDANLK